MDDREPSSLDRFLASRGSWLAGFTGKAQARRLLLAAGINGTIGTVLLAMGLSGGLGPGISGVEALAPAIGPLISTTVLLALSQALRLRGSVEPEGELRLTDEARDLVRLMISHLHGWSPSGRRHRMQLRHARRAASQGLWSGISKRRVEDALTPEAFQLLDRAAEQHNRIQGVLASGEPTGALQRLAPNVRAASDEAISELLHLAALLQRYPESAGGVQTQAEARLGELRELAEQLEAVRSEGTTPLALESPSRIQSVLSDLRAERMARRELSEETDWTAPTLTEESEPLRLGQRRE